jgi:hypothetical protein
VRQDGSEFHEQAIILLRTADAGRLKRPEQSGLMEFPDGFIRKATHPLRLVHPVQQPRHEGARPFEQSVPGFSDLRQAQLLSVPASVHRTGEIGFHGCDRLQDITNDAPSGEMMESTCTYQLIGVPPA